MSISPPSNRGLQKLNRELFKKSYDLVALRVPASSCRDVLTELRGRGLLEFPRLKSIVEDPKDVADGIQRREAKRLVLLSPHVVKSQAASEQLPPNVSSFVDAHKLEITNYVLRLDYDYWTTEQILRSILPDDLEVPSAYDCVGHIAHLNLRDDQLPFKNIIGQVLLDKNKHIRTVVNKTGNIDTTYRFFRMELLAGVDEMVATLKESNCTFRFDFSKVYWNSRLQTEHSRIVKKFKPQEYICDVFAGVGPYAMPAAKNRNCVVFANDLNPASYKYLLKNTKANKLEHLVKPYNMDGYAFIQESVSFLNDPSILKELESKKPRVGPKANTTGATKSAPEPAIPEKHFMWFNHYVMNLPDTALEFLGAFHGVLAGKEDLITPAQLPMVHCHCFSKSKDPKADVIARAEEILKVSLADCGVDVHDVRNVAPNKEMMCISFRLPASVAFGKPIPKE
ncbi:guanine(37)-N1-methyltransferase [Phlyctochytrium arcticum]|nr:guanine(37)-N1-methyltransferase [Phlyctochytrium arcticum]